MKVKNLKNKKSGITLIALVVTIIVLLILAGVSLSMISGENGILNKASNAKETHLEEEANEKVKLALAEWKAEKYDANSERSSLEELLKLRFGENNVIKDNETLIVRINGYEVPIKNEEIGDEPGKNIGGGNSQGRVPVTYVGVTGLTETVVSSVAYEELTGEIKTGADSGKIVGVVKEGTNLAPIPAGFTVSGNSLEQKISTGLVISDGSENQFVWVPVVPSDMVTKSGDNYSGILNNYGTPGREPDTLSNPSWADGNTTYLAIVGCSTIGEFATKIQTEFNSMAKSVEKYQGFYISRYELSGDENMLGSKAGTIVTTAATSTTAYTNGTTWYGLYNICKKYNTNSVGSNMIYGCQYDAMMRWMQQNGIDVTSTDLSEKRIRKNSDPTITGQSGDLDILNNVYDLLGGKYEWTQEANGDCFRISRGGSCGSDEAASSRFCNFAPLFADNSYSTRAALYIK